MGQILKVDLHLHTRDDRKDKICYSAFELLDEAHRQGFDAISITNHDTFTYSRDLRDYARDLDILLIPGIELTVEGCHVLVLGELKELSRVSKLDDLYGIKNDQTLLVAPHPFFPVSSGLGKKILEHLELFDAIEFSHCFTRWINFNNPAVQLARANGLPLTAFSDTHFLWQLGSAYSLVMAEKKTQWDIFAAIRKGEVEIVAGEMDLVRTLRTGWWVVSSLISERLCKPVAASRFNLVKLVRNSRRIESSSKKI